MSPDTRRALGALGERLAEEHLAGRGYRILERNFRTAVGELDLVASVGGALVFCEVKTRVAGSLRGPPGPLDGIGMAKRRRLRRMAGEWLGQPRARGDPSCHDEIRFDAIGVLVSDAGRLLSLEHVESAF